MMLGTEETDHIVQAVLHIVTIWHEIHFLIKRHISYVT